MRASRHIEHVTLLLVALSCALVQVALAARGPGAGAELLCVSAGLAFCLGVLSRRSGWEDWNARAVSCVLALALLPVLWDLVSRGVFRIGDPYEVQLAYILRNTMLGLAALLGFSRALGQATLSSFFLVMFGFLWSTGPLAYGLLVTYAIIGAWWLFAVYWDRLGGRFADTSERAIPLRPAGVAVGAFALLSLSGAALVSQTNATAALAGFFPSSGGTQWHDPQAHGGIGDGDQMVAGKDQASSFGPVESELFLESQMPSLYDAFNEFSDPPPIKKKQSRRAIPLAPSQVKLNHQKRGLSQQAKREFSTVRRTSTRTAKTEDRLSAALLHVKGRTPMHLALETYDEWDGRSLLPCEPEVELGTSLGEADATGKRWLNLSLMRPINLFKVGERSQVRVINLKTDRVPTPAGIKRVTLDNLHTASMFTFAADGSLAMAVDHIPQLTIFNCHADLRDRESVPLVTAAPVAEDERSPRVARLVDEWTRGVPAGWGQVEEVITRLRRDYAHDQEAMVPEEADDSVEHFLFESKRGPDYLFAASAAVMLRSLGYDTRVRSGFYVQPGRYDRVAQATPVLMEDAHFWVEVLTDNGYRITKEGDSHPGVWVTLEPTPGYEVLFAPESLWARACRALVSLCESVLAQPVLFGLVAFGVGTVLVTRRRIADGVLMGWWALRSRTVGVERLASMTLRLLEWRAWVYRSSRPRGTPLGKWETLRAQDDFIQLVSWALYGPGAPAPLEARAARRACRRAIHTPLATTGRSKRRDPIHETATERHP